MSSKVRWAILAVPCLFVLLAYAPTAHFFANQYDDAYITYRYAIHLAQGDGLVFNVGERTDAASSFLYTVLLAGFWRLGLHDMELIGGLLGLASLGVITGLTWRLARRLSGHSSVALFMALAAGLNGLLAGWSLSGMETLPWAACVLAALCAIVEGAAWPVTWVLVAMSAFGRVEGVLLMAAWGVRLLPWMGEKDRAVKASLLAPVLGMAGLLLAFIAFYAAKHAYYGVWISHAFAMKELASYYRSSPAELFRLWGLFASLPVLLSLWSLPDRRLWPIWAYFLLSLVSVATGPRSDWARYSVHLIPVAYVLAACGLVRLGQMTSMKQLSFMRQGAIALLALVLLQSFGAAAYNWRNMTQLADHQVCRRQIGEQIERHIPSNEPIASSDLGLISYVAIDHAFVDLVALTSADVLVAYQGGRPADEVLLRKHVHYIADTVSPHFADRVNELQALFPHVHTTSRFQVGPVDASAAVSSDGAVPVAFSCQARGVAFRIAELMDGRRNVALDGAR